MIEAFTLGYLMGKSAAAINSNSSTDSARATNGRRDEAWSQSKGRLQNATGENVMEAMSLDPQQSAILSQRNPNTGKRSTAKRTAPDYTKKPNTNMMASLKPLTGPSATMGDRGGTGGM